MEFDAYKDILFSKDTELGNISDFYLELLGYYLLGPRELLGYYLLGPRKRFEKLFKYYKKWEFDIDEEDARHLSLSDHDEKYYLPFFGSFGELIQAFVEFEETLFYLQNYPPRKYLKRLSIFEWGNYHLKAVNQQFYILQERILRFVNTVEKIAKEDGDTRFLKLEILKDEITDYLKPILSKRHEIVHEQTFIDEGLDRILAASSILKKKGEVKQVHWEIEHNPNADIKMKVKLKKRAAEISTELENLLHFLNSKFSTVSEIIKDWYASWENEHIIST